MIFVIPQLPLYHVMQLILNVKLTNVHPMIILYVWMNNAKMALQILKEIVV